jgi:hypothetical protein
MAELSYMAASWEAGMLREMGGVGLGEGEQDEGEPM